MSEPAPSRNKVLVQHLTVIALILVFFAQLTFGSRHLSLTVDEPSHFISGYSLLATGDLWTIPNHVHPPLVNIWSAWPLFLQPERPDPRALPSWGRDYARFIHEMWPLLGPVERIEWVTRFPIMLLAATLMALVYRWARDRSGHWGGVLAVAVMALDPGMIAHSQLSTTDLGVTLFTFACLFLLDRLVLKFTWRRALGTGLLLGATLASKASGLILLPVVAATVCAQYLGSIGFARRRSMDRRSAASGEEGLSGPPTAARRWLAAGAGVMVVGILVLWSTYLFEWRALPGMSRSFPLASHLRLLQTLDSDRTLRSFVFGKTRDGGWWWYFPFVYAIKTPIPTLIALGAAAIVAIREKRALLFGWMTLWLFPVTYAAIAVLSGINVGYRHLLPILPFCYVSIGSLGRWLVASPVSTRWRRVTRGLAALLGIWYAFGTLRVYPYALSYFNEFVGGPQNGYRYLADSSVDWGHSFKALQRYIQDEKIEWLWSSHYTWTGPEAYGVNYRPLPPVPEAGPRLLLPYDPTPGTYAISATTLDGLVVADPDTYEWFRHRLPRAQLGYGLLIYDVPERDPPLQWIAQCTIPETPLPADAIREGFRSGELRSVRFDCTQSWVYPQGGRSAGQYGMFRETWQRPDAFLKTQLAPARLSYEQTLNGSLPPFVLFEWGGDPGPTHWEAGQVRAMPPGSLPVQIETDISSLDPPVALDGPLAFAGYHIDRRDLAQGPSQSWREFTRRPRSAANLELWTEWQVKGGAERPLSLMAHLVDAEGRPIAIADGLGIEPDQWQVDDLLIQRHRFALPEDMPSGVYWLVTGAYWLDTTQRWTILQEESAVGDALLLTQIEVTQ